MHSFLEIQMAWRRAIAFQLFILFLDKVYIICNGTEKIINKISVVGNCEIFWLGVGDLMEQNDPRSYKTPT